MNTLIRFIAVCFVLFALPLLAQPLDPADAAEPARAVGPGGLLGIAAGLGLILRTVVIPLLRSPLARGFFGRIPLPVQMLLILVLSALGAAAETYATGAGLLEAIAAAAVIFTSSQVAWGVTAPLAERKRPHPPELLRR